DNHSPIDNDPEVDGTQTHQVGIHTEEVHHRQGKKQAERNDRGNDEAGAEIAQQQYHDEYDDQATQNQVFGNGVGGFVNEFAAVQKAVDDNAFRQGAFHFLETLFYAVDG